MKDIAAALGVSTATVCWALNGDRRVGQQTAEKVRKKAEEMQYVPNLTASRLRKWRDEKGSDGGLIKMAVLMDSEAEALVVRDVPEATLAQHGFSMTRVRVTARSDIRSRLRRCYQQGVDAILIFTLGFELPQDGLTWPEWNHFSVVQLPGAMRSWELPFITISGDFSEQVHLAWDKVVEHGYQRIGFILPRHQPQISDDLYREGMALACLNRQAASARIPILNYEPSRPNHPAPLPSLPIKHWVDEHKIDAVIGFSCGFWWDVRDLKVQGRPVGFASLQRNPNQMLDTPIAGVAVMRQSVIRLMLRTLRELTILRQRGYPVTPRTIHVRPVWIDGESLPHVNGRADG